MTKNEITQFIGSFDEKWERTIVIVDFGNVVRWDRSLRWRREAYPLRRRLRISLEYGQIPLKSEIRPKADFDQSRASLMLTQ